MFSNHLPPDIYHDEGVVLQAFPDTGVYTVHTTFGRIFNDAIGIGGASSSRGGSRTTYSKGDKVLLYFGLGYPIIIGRLPRPQVASQATPTYIFSGESAPPTGSTLHLHALSLDANKPKDMALGDEVYGSVGASMLALLRSGSAILRGGRNSEIFLSKLSGLVRVFSSNWEHFTDASTDVIKNLSGRLYRYVGYAKTYAESKVEAYKLHFYYGDVAAARSVKSRYNSGASAAASSAELYRREVTDSAGTVKAYLTVNDTGEEELWITNGSHFTRATSTAEELRFTWNDQHFISIKSDSIEIKRSDGAEVTLNSSSILAKKGGGELLVSDSVSRLKNGGHAVTVTSGGVSIT